MEGEGIFFHVDEAKLYFEGIKEIQDKIENGDIESVYFEIDQIKERATYFLVAEPVITEEEVKNKYSRRITGYKKFMDYIEKYQTK